MSYAKLKEDNEKIKDDLEHLKNWREDEKTKDTPNPDYEKRLKEIFNKIGVWHNNLIEFFGEDNEGLKDSIIKLKESEIALKGEIKLLNDTKREYENKISLTTKDKIILEERLKEVEYKLDRQKSLYQGNVQKFEEKNKNISDLHQNKIDHLKHQLKECQKKTKNPSNNQHQPQRANPGVKNIENTNIKLTNKLISLKEKMVKIYKMISADDINILISNQKEIKSKTKECLDSLNKL